MVAETKRQQAKKVDEVTKDLTKYPEEAGKIHTKTVDMQDENIDFS